MSFRSEARNLLLVAALGRVVMYAITGTHPWQNPPACATHVSVIPLLRLLGGISIFNPGDALQHTSDRERLQLSVG
jgi:hypothetical protein